MRASDHKTTNSRRLRVLLHVLAGGSVVITSLLADQLLAQPLDWGLVQSLGVVTGLGIVAIGLAQRRSGVLSRVSTNFCLALLSLFLFLAIGEGVSRALDLDFAGEEAAWRQIPIYYRRPISPTGAVFFRRPGPEQWTGRVLSTRLQQLNVVPNPYTNEPVITVQYDRRGFRNPADMSRWEIAVAGDSFTELGYLPYERLFTSIVAEILNVSVLNLGTSYTGPLSQLSYLEEYGISAETTHAIIVFFEGRDLDDLADEYEALIRWQETGQRDYRHFSEQPSLVKALYDVTRRLGQRRLDPVTAFFQSSEGEIAVSLNYTPPGSGELSSETLQHLTYFLTEYAALGEQRGITVWLAYMPAKRRVLHGQLEFAAGAGEALKRWRPTDLPEFISELCDRYGIRFIDLTPALSRETRSGKRLLYNSIYDTHLNARGSLIVGRELARHLSEENPGWWDRGVEEGLS